VNESKHNKEPFATLEEIREYLNELLWINIPSQINKTISW
jgi:hypothetical protein